MKIWDGQEPSAFIDFYTALYDNLNGAATEFIVRYINLYHFIYLTLCALNDSFNYLSGLMYISGLIHRYPICGWIMTWLSFTLGTHIFINNITIYISTPTIYFFCRTVYISTFFSSIPQHILFYKPVQISIVFYCIPL